MKFLIVEDDIFSSRGMAETLRATYPTSEVLQTRTLAGSIALLERHADMKLVVLDLNLPDSSEIKTLESLKSWCDEHHRTPRFVVVSGLAGYVDRLVEDCIEDCATAFIEKGAPEEEFCNAVAKVLSGGLYITKLYRREHVRLPSSGRGNTDIPLSEREYQVAEYLSEGTTYKEVANKLQAAGHTVDRLAEETIREHAQRICWKIKTADGEIPPTGTVRPKPKATVVQAFKMGRFRKR